MSTLLSANALTVAPAVTVVPFFMLTDGPLTCLVATTGAPAVAVRAPPPPRLFAVTLRALAAIFGTARRSRRGIRRDAAAALRTHSPASFGTPSPRAAVGAGAQAARPASFQVIWPRLQGLADAVGANAAKAAARTTRRVSARVMGAASPPAAAAAIGEFPGHATHVGDPHREVPASSARERTPSFA
jgi:hypothetical protein